MPHSSFPPHKRRPWLTAAAAVVLVVVLALALVVGIGGRGGSDGAASTCADVEFLGAAGSAASWQTPTGISATILRRTPR
ncbi:hypothetical protein [Corynebacterium variabile]|uniref:hypothetical protein n=1 Tax=Corynebacterium variabile TaxID=1727 RepID=UPI002897B8EC|nr:hypothetical protein [Corynebacterium variabile]